MSIKMATPRGKSLGTRSSTPVGVRSMSDYTKDALKFPLSFGDTAMHQTPSLLGMGRGRKKRL